jgi:hypothetical protein
MPLRRSQRVWAGQLATAVGANAVLCSVAIGLLGLARGLGRFDLEESVLVAGYVGGGFGALFAAVDAVLRYGL